MEGKNQFLLANCRESPVILEKHFFFGQTFYNNNSNTEPTCVWCSAGVSQGPLCPHSSLVSGFIPLLSLQPPSCFWAWDQEPCPGNVSSGHSHQGFSALLTFGTNTVSAPKAPQQTQPPSNLPSQLGRHWAPGSSPTLFSPSPSPRDTPQTKCCPPQMTT